MNETVKNLTTRKSAPAFKPDHISREELDEIIAAGLNAPSGMNAQGALLLAVQDDETVTRLSSLNSEVGKAMLSKMNPAMAAKFPADPFHGAKDVVAVVVKKGPTAIYDGSLVIGNMLNAAWSMGIDSRWIHRGKEVFETEEGKAILAKAGITDEVEGIGFCLLGHAAQEKPKTEIKPDRVFYV